MDLLPISACNRPNEKGDSTASLNSSPEVELTCVRRINGNLFNFGDMQKNLREIHSTEIKKRRKYGRFHPFSHHQLFYLATMFRAKRDCRTARKPRITLLPNTFDELPNQLAAVEQSQLTMLSDPECPSPDDGIAIVSSDPCSSSHISLRANIGELSHLFSTERMSSTVDDEAFSVSAVVRSRPVKRESVTLSIPDGIMSNFSGMSIDNTRGVQTSTVVAKYRDNAAQSQAPTGNFSVNALSAEMQRIGFYNN